MRRFEKRESDRVQALESFTTLPDVLVSAIEGFTKCLEALPGPGRFSFPKLIMSALLAASGKKTNPYDKR